MTTLEYFLIFVLVFYFVYTLRFAIKFNQTNTYFTGRQKFLHNLFIWFIPFIWILLLKALSKPTLGSHYHKKEKTTGSFYESWLGFWGDTSSHSGHDGGEHDSNGHD